MIETKLLLKSQHPIRYIQFSRYILVDIYRLQCFITITTTRRRCIVTIPTIDESTFRVNLHGSFAKKLYVVWWVCENIYNKYK